MPVFSTMVWSTATLIQLKLFTRYTETFTSHWLDIKKYSYFNGVSSDLQYILETDGTMYQDLDSLLWIQKQNPQIDKDLVNEIEWKTKIWQIEDMTYADLIDNHSIRDILYLVHKIPKNQWLLQNYKLIEKILT